MIRSVSIVLIVAIALQTLGCSTWRPLARMNQVPEDNGQSSMRDQVLGKLKEGMRVRIRVRESADVPIKGRVIECKIEEIGQESLTLIPITDLVRGTVKREFRLHYANILHIEYRKSDREANEYVVYLVTTTVLCLIIFYIALSQAQFD